MAPRWRKVVADLWGNKTRTLLTVLTIAVGVFAVGLVDTVGAIVLPDMNADYQASHPHVAIVYGGPFEDDALRVARAVPGVDAAEGRSVLVGRLYLRGGQAVPVTVLGLPPLGEQQIDRPKPAGAGGATAPAERQLLVDRSALGALPLQAGDVVRFELPDGHSRDIRVAGAVHDVNAPPYAFAGSVSAYATLDTVAWLGGTREYNALYLTVSERPTDSAHVSAVAQAAADALEKRGWTIGSTFVYLPGRHFATDITQGVMSILNVLGIATVLLSMFLVVNTITALLGQHVRQIGVMKAVGARTGQIVGLYVVMVLIFGGLALAAALPLAALAGYAVAGGLGRYLNFDLGPFRIPPEAVAWQAAVALLVPVAAALVPVLGSARLTVREAISSYGLGRGVFGRSAIDRLVERVRFLSRPLLISLRNTVRRKGRLALTLSTLTLGGAIFVAVFNLWAALNVDIEVVQGYVLSDVNVEMARPYRLDEVTSVARTVPGVTGIEGWAWAPARVLAPGGVGALDVQFMAPPGGSTLIRPVLTAGHWLRPDDENAVVVGNHLLKVRPDVKVGDTLVVKFGEKETAWHVVGIYELIGNVGRPIVYTNGEYLTRLLGDPGQAALYRVTTASSSPAAEKQAAQGLEAAFRRAGLRVTSVQTGAEWRAMQGSTIEVLVAFLLTMALLIGLVGALGLMGTMSMNVLERTREIGVLRAIGAPNGAVLQLVIVEGLLIGLLSWLLAGLLAVPITLALDYGVGLAIFTAPLPLVLGWNGIGLWLGGVVALSALASALPAWNAARLTVRDVLAYE